MAEEQDGAASGWLFDSRRSYFKQLDRYKDHKESHFEDEPEVALGAEVD